MSNVFQAPFPRVLRAPDPRIKLRVLGSFANGCEMCGFHSKQGARGVILARARRHLMAELLFDGSLLEVYAIMELLICQYCDDYIKDHKQQYKDYLCGIEHYLQSVRRLEALGEKQFNEQRIKELDEAARLMK